MKYITPVLLLLVLAAALITPVDNDWGGAIAGLLDGRGWVLDPGSLVSKISHTDLQFLIQNDPLNEELYKNKMFFSSLARIQLIGLFLFIAALVWYSGTKRKRIHHE